VSAYASYKPPQVIAEVLHRKRGAADDKNASHQRFYAGNPGARTATSQAAKRYIRPKTHYPRKK